MTLPYNICYCRKEIRKNQVTSRWQIAGTRHRGRETVPGVYVFLLYIYTQSRRGAICELCNELIDWRASDLSSAPQKDFIVTWKLTYTRERSVRRKSFVAPATPVTVNLIRTSLGLSPRLEPLIHWQLMASYTSPASFLFGHRFLFAS